MEDTLVARRSKRSTAGNRMEAALADFKAEELGMDVEEDADFALAKDEDDVFESDFESTDEEGAQEDVDAAAEKLIRQEESHVRKTGRSQLERITALAHARQAATFNPTSIAPPSDKPKVDKKLNRRVSLGTAVNAETGEILEVGSETAEGGVALVGGGKRHSTRTHTVLNTTASVTRSRDEVRKQSSIPKRVKVKTKAPTQSELIARALDMEDGNIAEHKNYLTLEEEKRRKARVIRTSVQGPLLRWISKIEERTVLALPPPPPVTALNSHYPTSSQGVEYSASASPYTLSSPYSYAVPPVQSPTISIHQPSSPFQQWPPPPPPPAYLQTPLRQSMEASSSPPLPLPQLLPLPAPLPAAPPVPPLLPPPQPIERTETVGTQYVVHEIGQTEKTTRPTWNSTMTAMFGDHVDWENLRVYTTKGRPTARPTQTCAVTGKVAKYLDPRTNVPFADLEAYQVLSQILCHGYHWSPSLQCYVSRDGSIFAQGGT